MRRPAPPRDIPPPLELECLKALWKLGEGSVKDVRDDLAASRNLAYTTVMTLLDRLVKQGRRHPPQDRPAVSVLSRAAARSAAQAGREGTGRSFFNGSQQELLAFLQGQPRQQSVAAQPRPANGELDTALL